MKAENARFFFEKYRITQIEYFEQNNSGEQLAVSIDPSGEYFEAEGRFVLKLSVVTFSEGHDAAPVWKISVEGCFKFDEPVPFEELPEYLYKNSIAITFPYIRAFLSTVTLQANTKIFILPLLNLSSLESLLRENTTTIKKTDK